MAEAAIARAEEQQQPVKRSFSNLIMSNGDIYLGKVLAPNGKRYNQYLEKATRFKYILDTGTDNLSFLRTAKDLYTLGVKNYRFMLKLYDMDLLLVDPYSPTITPEQIQRVNFECVRNIWYYLRVVSRFPEEGGGTGPGTGMRYQLNRGNLASTWCFVNGIDHYLVLPRQIGKTKSTLQCILWTYLFSSNTQMMFLCKDGPGSKNNLLEMKKQRDVLPLYMQAKWVINDDGEVKVAPGDNQTYLKNPLNGNRIVTATGGTSIDAADRCGRGLTQAVQFYDEVEFTAHIGTIIDAAGPAFNTASRNARANGAPYCRVFTSTPGNLDSSPVMETNEFRSQTMKFTEALYDADIADVKNIVNENSAVEVVYIEYQYKQLGKDEKWFVDTCKKVSNNRIKIIREILLKRIRGSSISPFEPEDLEEIAANTKEPIQVHYINQLYPIYIYSELNKNIPYIVGVDCASGRVGDFCAITVVDPYTERPVAEFRSNITNTVKLRDIIVNLVMNMIPRAIVVVENNNMGVAVIDMLKMSPISYNLYYDSNKYFVPDANERLDAKGFAVLEAKNDRCFGLNTNPKTRDMMMNILFDRVRNNKSQFVTKFLTEDITALIRTPLGKVQAANGCHDDSIMSYLIAMYTLFNGSNLARYGFVKGDRAPEAEKEKTRREYFEELPEDVQQFFAGAMSMETSDEYNERMQRMSDLQRISSNMDIAEGTGSARNTTMAFEESAGVHYEIEDTSWVDELND